MKGQDPLLEEEGLHQEEEEQGLIQG